MQNLKQQLSKYSSDDLLFAFVALTFFLLPTGTAPPLITVSAAFMIWLFSGKIFQIKSIVIQPWFWPVIPFLLLPWIGLLYSQNMELGLDYAIKTKYWLAVLLTAGIQFDEKRIYILIKSLWAGLFLGAILALVQISGFMPPIKEDFLGFGIAYTLISLYLIIGILMISFCFKKNQNHKKRILFLALAIFFLFHLSVLRGRAGW